MNSALLLKVRVNISKGYATCLVVVGCDAEVSWKATIARAEKLYASKEAPRLVPFDKYDAIVNMISTNLRQISDSGSFSNIFIVGMNGNIMMQK